MPLYPHENMLTILAVELLGDVADECEHRLLKEDNRLLVYASDAITEAIEILVESDEQ